MADQTVEIENFGEGGVASEATLQQLLKAMDRLAKGQGTDAKKAKDQAKKYHDEMKSGVKVFNENRKALEEHTDTVEESNQAIGRFGRGALGLAISGVTTLAGSAFNLSKELLVGGENFADFARHIPLVGSHLAGLVGVLDDQINSFREMTQVGVDFGGSIFNLQRMATQSGLSLANFQRVIGENSQTLALMGGSAADGARRFTSISGELQSNFGPQLSRLGMTMEETADYTASYLEIQTRLGRSQRMSDSQLAAGSAAYALQLDRLARITGKRRDQIAEELEQQMNDQRIRAIISTLNEDQARALQNVTGAIENADLREAITELIATGGVPLENELARSIARMTPEIAAASAALKEGSITEEQYFEVLRRNSRAMEDFQAANGQMVATVTATGNMAFSAASALQGMGNIGEDFQQIQQDQIDAMESGERGLLDFGRRLQELRNEVIGRFLETDTFKKLEAVFNNFANWLVSGDGLTKIEEVMTKFTTWFDGLLTDFQDQGIWATITERVGGAINDMIGGLATKIGLAIIGLFAGASFIRMVGSGISSAIGGLFTGGGGGAESGGGRRGGGRGNAGASMGRNIGGFVGGIAGGAMEGAARGLAAFANPAILVGAGILGASITAIGAGIAGATWLMGSALPTFAEGMEAFEDVDGAALRDAATGMLAISGAMAAFGAGSAVAGLGNLVGTISDGIASLFGGEDPMEKLQRFASYDIDADRVENNARAMVAFSAAMAAQGGGAAASGLGNLVGGIADGITSFFGGETGFPYDRITEFASYDINAAAVEANARAMVAFNNALMSASAGTAVSGIGTMVGAIGDFIGGLFGGDSPIEQVQEFGNMEINAEGVIANANAMAAMNQALSSMSETEIGDFEIPRNLSSRLNDLADIDSVRLAEVAPALTIISRALSSMSGIDLTTAEIPRDFADRLNDLGEVEGSGLASVAQGMTAIAGVTGLSTNINTLNSLDFESINSYNSAIETLVETLEELNTVLAETNDGGLFGGGTGVAAADVLGQIGGSTAGSNQQLQQLNNTMLQVLEVLREQYDVQEETARGTRRLSGNLIAGGVAR